MVYNQIYQYLKEKGVNSYSIAPVKKAIVVMSGTLDRDSIFPTLHPLKWKRRSIISFLNMTF